MISVDLDSSITMLPSGNIVSNLRPHCRNENPVYSVIYSDKIKRSIQQDTAPSCTETDCITQCSQAYNEISISHTNHAKCSDYNIIHKCPQQGGGVAGIVAPPRPTFE